MKKLKKGSIEAKRYMAKIRSMRKTKKRKVNGTSSHKDTKSHNVNIRVLSGNKKETKYIFEHIVQGNYGYGWEDLTTHNIRRDAVNEKKVYDNNENYPHRVISRRVLNPLYKKTSIGDYKHNKSQFFEAKKPKKPRKKRTRKQNEWKVSRTKSGRFKKGGITKLNGISVTGTPPYKDENAVREIRLYADNNSQLYFSRKLPILKNLQKKYQKGTFDVNKASKLWRYYIDDAMQRYHKEFGSRGKWYNMLDTSDRQLLANEYAEETLSEFQLGNFVY